MSAAATLRGVEVMRREINAAALTDTTDSMKNIKVVVVDIGSVGTSIPQSLQSQDVYKAMEDWTPSEKVAYGPAFSSILEEGNQYGVPRKPADVSTFVNALVEVVSGGRKGGGWAFALGLGLGRVRNWIRGERFAVGAGGTFYLSYFDANKLLIVLVFQHTLTHTRRTYLPKCLTPSSGFLTSLSPFVTLCCQAHRPSHTRSLLLNLIRPLPLPL
jgi:hypothetical protein